MDIFVTVVITCIVIFILAAALDTWMGRKWALLGREITWPASAWFKRGYRSGRRALCKNDQHEWQHVGGRNAGCCDECSCSVPVHQCARCGDWDYGDNDEAAEIIRQCDYSERE